MQEGNGAFEAVLAVAIIAPLVVGAVAMLGGVASLLIGEMIGSGVMFIAAAIAFGLLALAVYN